MAEGIHQGNDHRQPTGGTCAYKMYTIPQAGREVSRGVTKHHEGRGAETAVHRGDRKECMKLKGATRQGKLRVSKICWWRKKTQKREGGTQSPRVKRR